MAGYVMHVATHFETAPNTKAEKAGRAWGDGTRPVSSLAFSNFCFN